VRSTTLARVYDAARGRQTGSRTRSSSTTSTPSTTSKPELPEGDAKEEQKGNLLVYLDYRREDNSCPEGQVIDIYGYCRSFIIFLLISFVVVVVVVVVVQ
jgi:hypothetical protein